MTWLEIIIVLICSFIFGSIAGLPIIIIEKWQAFSFMIKGGFVGLFIGFSCISLSLFFYKTLKSHQTLLSYISVVIISALGTFIGAYGFGLKKMQYIIFLIFFSEIISLSVMISIHHYKNKLNSKLHDKQKRISSRVK